MKKHFSLKILFLVAAFLFFLSGWSLDNKELSFRTYSEAFESGLVGKGKFIPDILPPSSTNIQVKYNIDVNSVFMSFVLPEKEILPFYKQFSAVSVIPLPYQPTPKWWHKVDTTKNDLDKSKFLLAVSSRLIPIGENKIINQKGFMIIILSEHRIYFFEPSS